MMKRSGYLASMVTSAALLLLGGAAASGCMAEGEPDNGYMGEEHVDNGDVGDQHDTDDNGDGETVGERTQSVWFDGHDYLFFTTNRQSWSDARATCRDLGYELARVDSPAEERFLHREQEDRGGGYWWLGYTDQTVEGSWVWVDGDAFGYSNWAGSEPNDYGGGEDCAEVYTRTGKWNDVPCQWSRRFICESPPTFTYSASETESAQENTYDYSLTLTEGTELIVGNCDMAGASFNGDTYLRITSPFGREVAVNDDACNGFGSKITYTVPRDGTYTIRSGCYAAGSCTATVAMLY